MSSLQRYKKSGGFFQLLSLIETFGPQKRDKFLDMIEQESCVWASALREKMLSLERIFGWPDQVVIEVFKRLPPKSQAYAMTALKDEYKAKILPFISQAEQRRHNDIMSESKPKPEEVQATLIKFVEFARKMLQDRELHPEKFDEKLIIPDGYEAKLEEMGGGGSAPQTETAHAVSGDTVIPANAPMAPAPAAGGAEVLQLQRSLTAALKENKTLKDEVRILREKLEQIRKIA